MKKKEEPITMDDIVERARISYLYWYHAGLVPGADPILAVRQAILNELETIFTREVLEADEIPPTQYHSGECSDKTVMPSDQWLREYVLRYWKSAHDKHLEAFDFLKAADSYEDLQLRLRCFSYIGKFNMSKWLLDALYDFITTGKEIP